MRGFEPASISRARTSCFAPSSDRFKTPLIRGRQTLLRSSWMVAGMAVFSVESMRELSEPLRLARGGEDGAPPAAGRVEAFGVRGE